MSSVHLEEADAVRSLAETAESLRGATDRLSLASDRMATHAVSFLNHYARGDGPDPTVILADIGVLREHMRYAAQDMASLEECLSHLRVGLLPHPDADPRLEAESRSRLAARARDLD